MHAMILAFQPRATVPLAYAIQTLDNDPPVGQSTRCEQPVGNPVLEIPDLITI